MMKTGKNKRLLASILAASMLLAMSPFALAEGTEDTTNQTGQEQSQGQPTGGAALSRHALQRSVRPSIRLLPVRFMKQTAMSLSSCSVMLRKISRLTSL